MWPEIQTAKTEKRHELVLSGNTITQRISKGGLDGSLFDLTTLNYLNISETNLKGIPDEIAKLANLQTLVLHSNQLESVNGELEKLSKLKILDLSRNLLKEVPESLVKLTQVVSLNLSGNQLENCVSLQSFKKLSVLDLSNNKLTTFPDICHAELASLAEVKLSLNVIPEIPHKISVLPALKLLEIASNKLKVIPGELGDCHKLKDLNLKQNPVSDRRLLKLIDQSRTTKQVLDYIKAHCAKTAATAPEAKDDLNKSSEEENGATRYLINVVEVQEEATVVVDETVKNVREHIVCCLVNKLNFTELTFKKFIQLQNKLHDTVCNKRVAATIATHDFNKLPPGSLNYTTSAPGALIIKPLNRASEMSGAELFSKLQTEANNLRKEKKRSTYSGIHKYLNLIEDKKLYPCLLSSNRHVISFPPITNSDISKIDLDTKRILVEVSSSTSQQICRMVLDTMLKAMVELLDVDLEVQQVKVVDSSTLKNIVVYPSKNDLCVDKKTSNIKINMY